MTADLKNEAQKALDAYDKYESHRDALQFAAAIESLRKAVELQAPAEAPEIGEVTWQQAADAIDDLDDYARMMVGVDPSGPRETLYRFLEQAKAAFANVQPKSTDDGNKGIRFASDCHPGEKVMAVEDVHRLLAAQGKAAQAPAPAQSAAYLTGDGKLHVTAWECHGCGHRGINDGDDASEACSDCDWRGPCPDEDVCPGCGREGTMVSACPKCGDRYYIKAEADIVIPTAAQAPAVAHQGGVDCIGLALDLEARAKTVESQTTERAMKAAAHGLRLLASSQTHAVAHGDGDANDMRSPTDHIDIAVALLETWARGDPAPLDRADARPVVIARLQSARAAIQASGIDAKP